MRIGELSRRTGIAVPTIKYYLREGLLPPGRLTSPNQAAYDSAHERRLRLVRALTETGGLSVAAVREVLGALDEPGLSAHQLMGAAQAVVSGHRPASGQSPDPARETVLRLLERRGWRVEADHPSVAALASALTALRGAGHGEFERLLDEYAAASERVAAADLAYARGAADTAGQVERVVVGTVLGDAVCAALRRLAQADASAGAHGTAPSGASA